MTTTFTLVNAKLDRFLGDAYSSGQTRFASLELRVNAWNWAQRLFVKHTPRQRSATLEIDTDNRSAIMPQDLFAVEMLYDSTEERWWKQMVPRAGDKRYLDEDTLEFWTWAGGMFFETEKSYHSGDLTLYYWAYWPEIEYTMGDDVETITYNQDTVYTPSWAESALLHLTAAFLFTPSSVEAADLNQYKIKVDAGNPTMNPRALAAREHLWWWNAILDQFPLGRDVGMVT